MAFGVEYIINLIDRFTPAAEKVAKSAADAERGLGKLGQEAARIDGQMNKAAEGLNKIAAAQERAARTSNTFTEANSRAAQARARATDLEIASLNRIEKMQVSMLERQAARQQLIASGQLKEGRGGAGREVGIMGGLFGLSMLHTDVLGKWLTFDDEMRRIRGTMAGQLSDSDMAELRRSAIDTSRGTRFAPSDIAKILLSEAERGVLVNERTPDGRLLGGVIAKQMLGVATGTGEDPAKTFETHLAIARGFEMPFSKFPHISDTIASIHQQTGISLKQIETQMGQLAAYAHASGWTEEQTVGAVGYLAKRGMGQYAGSGLARLISKSQAWSKPAAEFWHSLHINKEDVIDKTTGGMISPDAMMRLLQSHTAGMRPADVAAAFSKMFGDRGVKIASALLNGDPAELRGLINGLDKVNGRAEAMGEEGSKGGAAGIARFSAALDRMRTAIGESGYGDWIGGAARRLGDLFDAVADGPAAGKNAMGALSAVIDGASKLALPLMALQALGGFAAIGGLFRGAAWLTGLSQLKNLAPALSMFAVGGASGVLRFASDIGALVARSTGLSAVATNIGLVAGSARLLLGMTGIGAALFVGYEVVKNWDAIAAAAERAWNAMKALSKGNTEPIKDIGSDIAKTLGIETPKDPRLSKPHGRFGPGWHGFGTQAPDAAAAATAAAQQRVQADVNVRTHLDPIIINPTRAQVDVRVFGKLDNVQGSGSATVPLSATAPRGETSAMSPSNPQVAK